MLFYKNTVLIPQNEHILYIVLFYLFRLDDKHLLNILHLKFVTNINKVKPSLKCTLIKPIISITYYRSWITRPKCFLTSVSNIALQIKR